MGYVEKRMSSISASVTRALPPTTTTFVWCITVEVSGSLEQSPARTSRVTGSIAMAECEVR